MQRPDKGQNVESDEMPSLQLVKASASDHSRVAHSHQRSGDPEDRPLRHIQPARAVQRTVGYVHNRIRGSQGALFAAHLGTERRLRRVEAIRGPRSAAMQLQPEATQSILMWIRRCGLPRRGTRCVPPPRRSSFRSGSRRQRRRVRRTRRAWRAVPWSAGCCCHEAPRACPAA